MEFPNGTALDKRVEQLTSAKNYYFAVFAPKGTSA
jgi:hypothetical protein